MAERGDGVSNALPCRGFCFCSVQKRVFREEGRSLSNSCRRTDISSGTQLVFLARFGFSMMCRQEMLSLIMHMRALWGIPPALRVSYPFLIPAPCMPTNVGGIRPGNYSDAGAISDFFFTHTGPDQLIHPTNGIVVSSQHN